MRRHSLFKYLFFALLYFIQGATLAYIVNFQKPYLFSKGLTTETLGLFTSSLLAPFILKIFLGMLSDRVPWGQWGSRKPYMILGLVLFSASYFSVMSIDPAVHFGIFWAMTWLASLGLALFDTCADGWAIDVADESEQSTVQASMVAGKSLGLITMSFIFGIISLSRGFATVFATLAVMGLALAFIVALVPTGRRISKPPHEKSNWSELLNATFICFALYGIIYSISSFGTDGLLSLHLSQERGAGAFEVGFFGMMRGTGALIGAWLYALVMRRTGLPRAQVLALAALGLGCLLPLTGVTSYQLGLIWGLVWGFQETAFVTLAMRQSEGAWAATFFAICMVFSNIGTAAGEAIGGQLVPHVGFGGTFMIFAGVAWISLAFVKQMTKA